MTKTGSVVRGLAYGIHFFALLAVVAMATSAHAGSARVSYTEWPLKHTPRMVAQYRDLGPTDGSTPVTVRVWLKLHNGDALDQLAAQVIDETSLKYEQWLTPSQMAAQFYPSDTDIATVRNYLVQEGLTLSAKDQSQLYVAAMGSVTQIQNIFKVKIHNFDVDGKILRSNTTDPVIDPSIQALVATVTGLNNRVFRTNVFHPGMGAKKPIPVGDPSITFEHQCFHPSETKNFTSADGQTTATYSGNRFGPDNGWCMYTADEVETAYGMKDLYQRNLDGRGETVVIVDAFGSPATQAELADFSTQFGLPPANLTILQPVGQPVVAPWTADQEDWAFETSMDVQTVHAIAPGADIVLFEPASDMDSDLEAGLAYIVQNHVGDVVSCSWDGVETLVDPSENPLVDNILKMATVQGISMQFAAGDDGDNSSYTGGYVAANFPSSAYHTDVGGVTLALNADSSIQFQTAWGVMYTQLTNPAATQADGAAMKNAPLATLANAQSFGGSGGGESRIFAKPRYQRHIAGYGRMLPDISYQADGSTPLATIVSGFDDNGNPITTGFFYGNAGGTSLSCPMFSAMWAIANQNVGHSLGLAAPHLYRLSKTAITDIVPVGSNTNVSGSITTAAQGETDYSSLDLSLPLTYAPFLNGMVMNSLFDRNLFALANSWSVISFGTDSTLAAAPGWDNATGMGVPNGHHFVDELFWQDILAKP